MRDDHSDIRALTGIDPESKTSCLRACGDSTSDFLACSGKK